MICPVCNKNFEPRRRSQIYCSRKCCKTAYYNRECSRDEMPDQNALRYFFCEECGRGVNIYNNDRRQYFCCGKCYLENKERRKRERRRRLRSDNLGMSSGMSLSSLIRRERQDLL